MRLLRVTMYLFILSIGNVWEKKGRQDRKVPTYQLVRQSTYEHR